MKTLTTSLAAAALTVTSVAPALAQDTSSSANDPFVSSQTGAEVVVINGITMTVAEALALGFSLAFITAAIADGDGATGSTTTTTMYYP